MNQSKKEFLFSSMFMVAICTFLLLYPDLAHASLESSLDGLKHKLTGVILPLLSVIGIALGAISFFSGNPQAKTHIVYAIIGCCLGFGAQNIVDMIEATVR